MKDPREEVGTKACIVGKILEPDETGWTHGQNERREITEKIRDKDTWRLDKTRPLLTSYYRRSSYIMESKAPFTVVVVSG